VTPICINRAAALSSVRPEETTEQATNVAWRQQLATPPNAIVIVIVEGRAKGARVEMSSV
jgi:hypothetical protein